MARNQQSSPSVRAKRTTQVEAIATLPATHGLASPSGIPQIAQFLKIDSLSDNRRGVIFVYLIFAGAIVSISHGSGYIVGGIFLFMGFILALWHISHDPQLNCGKDQKGKAAPIKKGVRNCE